MTDFRNLTLPHDLRSQLGLKPFDRKAFAENVCSTLSADQVCKMSILGEALRFEPKPLDPADATPDPLHRTITAMGCTSQAQARRLHKWLEGIHGIGNVTVNVNVTNNASPPKDLDTTEIIANIRKMIASPEVQRLRTIGMLSAGPRRAIDVLNAAERFYGEPADPQTLQPYPKRSIQLDETPISEMNIPEPGRRIPIGVSSNYVLDFVGVGIQDGATAAMLSRAESVAGADQDKLTAARKKFVEAFSLLTEALQRQ